MKLKELLKEIEYEVIELTDDIEKIEVTYIESDSRKMQEGAAFVCVDGTNLDGHNFIDSAIKNGAKTILVTKEIETKAGINYIKINKNMREVMPILGRNFYHDPSAELTMIGVTGTKGKTTTTFMLKHIFEEAGHKVGTIGTIGNFIGDDKISEGRTTPQPIELNELLDKMITRGVDTVIMEVSSHALDLHRVDLIKFNIGIFTNLSQDHLDYHKTFENYFLAKAKLFSQCDLAVINTDDEYGKRLYDMCKVKKVSIGIDSKANFMAEGIQFNLKDLKYELISVDGEKLEIEVPIPGKFSAYNSLCAIAASKCCLIESEAIEQGLKKTTVPGRAEIVKSKKNFSVMVDYAHSPASLESILKAVKSLDKGRIISIFGCGGDRDTLKRPIMGRISGELADITIITSDNPRSENPQQILNQIEEGIKETNANYVVIENRREAIEYGIKIAKENDIVVIAGKGHETYQEINGEKHHFDDVEEAERALANLESI